MHAMLTRGIWNVLEVEKWKIYLCMKLTVWCNALHNALHMVHNVVRYFIYETVIATSSWLDNGLIKSKHCVLTINSFICTSAKYCIFVYDSVFWTKSSMIKFIWLRGWLDCHSVYKYHSPAWLMVHQDLDYANSMWWMRSGFDRGAMHHGKQRYFHITLV